MRVLFLMFLLHIIDDFVLQPVCLSKLKQKNFWNSLSNTTNDLYKNDYKMALFIHGLSWSIMIHIPIFLFCDYVSDIIFIISVFGWGFLHSYIDNMKANEKIISLVMDQTLHFIQIIGLYIGYLLIQNIYC